MAPTSRALYQEMGPGHGGLISMLQWQELALSQFEVVDEEQLAAEQAACARNRARDFANMPRLPGFLPPSGAHALQNMTPAQIARMLQGMSPAEVERLRDTAVPQTRGLLNAWMPSPLVQSVRPPIIQLPGPNQRENESESDSVESDADESMRGGSGSSDEN